MFVIFVDIIHVLVSLFLVIVVLLQQGKGGGLTAFGGGAAAQVFGGGGAGNILTRATAICAALFMLTSITLARSSSEGDRDLKQLLAEKAKKEKDRGTQRKDPAPAPSSTPSAAPSTPAP